MESYRIYTKNGKGLCLCKENGISWENFFGAAGITQSSMPQAHGLYDFESDEGRFEGEKLLLLSMNASENELDFIQKAGSFEIRTVLHADEASGVFSWKTMLKNTANQPHMIYACLPRITLTGAGYEAYSQFSSWSAENQGAWTPLHTTMTLNNMSGCSTFNATPFLAMRQQNTHHAFVLHVLPIGDWIIKAKKTTGAVNGKRANHTIVEAGLSNESLRLKVDGGVELKMPELLMYTFSGDIREAGIALQRYLHGLYPNKKIPVPSYNNWFYDFDLLNPRELKKQVVAAKIAGCGTFIVDAGWNGEGLNWKTQVGNWNECKETAFKGHMNRFFDYVRSQGMDAGLWLEPERACKGTPVYENHPDWFLRSDAVLFDYSKPEVIEYLTDLVTGLIQKYGLKWIMLDFNTDMFRDLNGTNFYYYALGERKLYEQIIKRNPDCAIEGNSSGGRRSDIENTLQYYQGFFISDTVNPVEQIRVREGYSLRNLPAFSCSWYVPQEVDFPQTSFKVHNRKGRRVFTCGDFCWGFAADYSPEFCLAVNRMGELGLNGDLASLSDENLAIVKKAVEEHIADRSFLENTICYLHTEPKPLHDHSGWSISEYAELSNRRSRIYAFRLQDETTANYVFPKIIEEDALYRIVSKEKETKMSGREILHFGIRIDLETRYSAAIVDIFKL